MLENDQLSFAFRFKIGINRICLNSSLLVLTCTFNGWIILWTKGRSKRPPRTFLRNLCLRGGGRLQRYFTVLTNVFYKSVQIVTKLSGESDNLLDDK